MSRAFASGLSPAVDRHLVGPDNPWWIVAAMFAAQMVGSGTLPHYALALLLNVVSAEYDWSRGTVSGAIALYLFCGAAAAPFFGAFIDRWGPRPPAMFAAILFCFALFLLSLISNRIELLGLFVALGLFSGGANGTSFMKALTGRIDRRRGLALSLGAAGLGVGGVLLPLLTAYLISHYGWRAGFAILAAIVALVALNAIWWGLRPRVAAASAGVEARMDGAGSPPWRDRSFWLIAGTVGLSGLGIGGGLVHAPAIMADRGISTAGVAAFLSGAGLASLIGRILGGYLMDLFFAPRIAAILLLVGFAGGLLFAFGQSPAATAIGVICFGFALGAESDVIGYLLGRYCRFDDFGKALGVLLLVYVTVSALSIFLLGVAYDLSGSYALGFGICAVFALAASLLVQQLGPYPRGAVAGGDAT